MSYGDHRQTKHNKVVVDDQCDNCGSDLELFTDASQYGAGEHGCWIANDGDVAVCVECLAVHGVHVDGDSGDGWLGWDGCA